jgi:RNA recognition motif-containing protein
MSQRIYVGNLPLSMTEEGLRTLFSKHGEVDSVAVISDRDTGQPRGFAFVEMATGGQNAIQALNNHEVDGRVLKVNEAKARTEGASRRPRW